DKPKLWGDGKWEVARNLLASMIKSGLEPSSTLPILCTKQDPSIS
ncbi:hypothetical protein MIMGU_mgv1a0254152mg, partial [Erythranthe guttata]